MRLALLIMIAGGVGALARHALGSGVQDAMQAWLGTASTTGGERAAWGAFPWGTLAVNLLGCFLFGLVWAAAAQRDWLTPTVRAVALTGFMGAFTTFSTYAFDSAHLLEEGRWIEAAANLGGQVVLGLVAMFLGLALGRWIA
jgi:CrcB protein